VQRAIGHRDIGFAAPTLEAMGTLPEITAQWAAWLLQAAFDSSLELIVETGTPHFDMSKLLVVYIGCHNREGCKTVFVFFSSLFFFFFSPFFFFSFFLLFLFWREASTSKMQTVWRAHTYSRF
jgi:hypothetical protein